MRGGAAGAASGEAARRRDRSPGRVYPRKSNASPRRTVSLHPELPLVIVVSGPTATGKSRLGVDLARRLGGEVVNADSRYLYRGLDIGTAKPTATEMEGIPHHLIDIVDPSEEMSLATYQGLAFAAIDDVASRGQVPILVGGTPLYVNAVVENWRIPVVPPQPEIRARLESEIAEHGLERVADRLATVDPVAAERSSRNARRVVRALEVHEVTGRPMSELEGKGPPRLDAVQIVLELDQQTLGERIDRRVDEHIAAGLLDEVRGLLEAGVAPTAPAMSSIGYRQLLPVIAGTMTLAEGAGAIRRDTRRYVKHQRTWLRKAVTATRIDASRPDLAAQALAATEPALRRHERVVQDEPRLWREPAAADREGPGAG